MPAYSVEFGKPGRNRCNNPVSVNARQCTMHPRGMSRDAQAVYWYLKALGLPRVPLQKASWDSGVPEGPIYRVIREYPATFALDGNNLAWHRAGRNSRITP